MIENYNIGYDQLESLHLLSAHGTSGVLFHPREKTFFVEDVLRGATELDDFLATYFNGLHADAASCIILCIVISGFSAMSVDEVLRHRNSGEVLPYRGLIFLELVDNSATRHANDTAATRKKAGY